MAAIAEPLSPSTAMIFSARVNVARATRCTPAVSPSAV